MTGPGDPREPRALRNGAGEMIEVSSHPAGDMDGEWWADTYRVAAALSRGDRSVVPAALKQDDQEEVALVTARGSVTNELWSRLERLGYFRPGEVPDGMEAFADAHVLTDAGRLLGRLEAFLEGSRVIGESDDVDPKAVGATCVGLLRWFLPADRFSEASAFRQVLMMGRRRAHPVPEGFSRRLVEAMLACGVLERIEEGGTRPTFVGMFAGPFVLDARAELEAHPLTHVVPAGNA